MSVSLKIFIPHYFIFLEIYSVSFLCYPSWKRINKLTTGVSQSDVLLPYETISVDCILPNGVWKNPPDKNNGNTHLSIYLYIARKNNRGTGQPKNLKNATE